MPPPAEYASRFAFMTDHTYADTFLVVVQKAIDGVFADVELDCAGVLGGFQAVGSEGLYRTTTVRLSGGRFEPQPYRRRLLVLCDNGAHTLRTDGLLTGMVWQWSHMGAAPRNWDGCCASFGFGLYGLPRASVATPPQ